MLVTIHIFIGCLLAGLALRAGEMIAGAWAMRLAMRKALKAYRSPRTMTALEFEEECRRRINADGGELYVDPVKARSN